MFCYAARLCHTPSSGTAPCTLLGENEDGRWAKCMKRYLEDHKDDREGGAKASDAEVGPGIRAHG